MNFSKQPGDLFTIGRTLKNNNISFADVPEDKLTILDPKKDKNTNSVATFVGRNKINEVKPSVITIYCSFEMTSQMIDILEKSKIVQVQNTRNNRKQVELYPLFGFSFNKLQEVLNDLSSRFEL